jgi:hypothetical protein
MRESRGRLSGPRIGNQLGGHSQYGRVWNAHDAGKAAGSQGAQGDPDDANKKSRRADTRQLLFAAMGTTTPY